MCGICGIVSLEDNSYPGAEVSLSTQLSQMLRKLSHRGPQGSGVNISGGAALGAQRLAIRGLNDSPQPLVDTDSGIVALCNGEIDNHNELRLWLTQRGRPVHDASDVSVLPGLYLELGETFVKRLRGVFAIAIWDPRERKVILARDRAGERSLHYFHEGGFIFFATEIAALVAGLSGDVEIDRGAVAGYLSRGHFLAPTTPFRGVKKVCPGEVVVFSPGQATHFQYWHWPVVETPKSKPSVHEFDRIFQEAVRVQTAVDVDYGFFLSGGVDSSLIAAIAAKIRPERKAFFYTVRFSELSYDEGAFAKKVAGLAGSDIVSVLVEPEMFPSELEHIVSMTGEPLSDPAWIPTAVLSRRAAQDVRIVFSGEGGDELFGGYPTYMGAMLAIYYDRLPTLLRRVIRKIIEALPPSERKVPLSFLLKKFVEGEGMKPFARHLLWTGNISPDLLRRLGVGPVPQREPMGGVLLDLIQLYDFETSLAEGLLSKADRGGMSASLEIRCPFLDYSVMEFAASLPPRSRVNGIRTKAFIKSYALNYLPRDIVYRRKRGLSVPIASWLRGPLRSWAEEKLESGRLEQVGVRTEGALSLMQEHVSRQRDHARALWSLLVLDEWLIWNAVRQGNPDPGG